MTTHARPLRLYGFAWFVVAAGVLGGVVLLKLMGVPARLGLDDATTWILTIGACAFLVGLGVGELRGLDHARGVRARTESGA